MVNIMKVNDLEALLSGIKNRDKDFVVQFIDSDGKKRTLDGIYHLVEVEDMVALRIR